MNDVGLDRYLVSERSLLIRATSLVCSRQFYNTKLVSKIHSVNNKLYSSYNLLER
jgi:hypothetical protein